MVISSWKKMKKSTKIGLVTSAVYTPSILAIPAFASNIENQVEKPVLQPLDLTQMPFLVEPIKGQRQNQGI